MAASCLRIRAIPRIYHQVLPLLSYKGRSRLKSAFAAAAYGLPPTVNTAIAIGIFVATLLLIMLRPKKLNEAFAALAGAALMLLAGIVSPLRAFKTLLGDWNIFLFFLGMMTLSALAERAGFFDWLAARAASISTSFCSARSLPPFSPTMPPP